MAIALLTITGLRAQNTVNNQTKIAVLNIESKELLQDAESLGKLARLKLQKHPKLSVFRDHDVRELFENDQVAINNCYGIQCLSDIGDKLGADQMLSGSAERFGERIVINLIIVDVKSRKIISSDVSEYYNLGAELEGMIEISVNNLMGVESDPMLLNALVRKETTLSDQVVERLNLNGPRMGLAYVYGHRGERLMATKAEGGFDMAPIMSQFGYQFEVQYLSAGNLQALVEFLPMISGMDQGMFIPSITVMNGFRHSRTGIEFAFGPTFRITQEAMGYQDPEDGNRWKLLADLDPSLSQAEREKYESIAFRSSDSRGKYHMTYAFTLAAGKTFHSGHLNVPVNLFYSPGKHGGIIGASFGFNIRKK